MRSISYDVGKLTMRFMIDFLTLSLRLMTNATLTVSVTPTVSDNECDYIFGVCVIDFWGSDGK